jgi:hypothetical protein
MCVLIFYKPSMWKISHSKKKWAGYDKNVHWSSFEVHFILVRLQWNLNFLDGFSKTPQISNLMKIRPVGAELFHADEQRDMTKPNVAFRNSANAPTKWFSGLWSSNYTRTRGYGAHRNIHLDSIPWENNNTHNDKPLPAFTSHKIYIKCVL